MVTLDDLRTCLAPEPVPTGSGTSGGAVQDPEEGESA
jgi:hypothetical protein